MTAAPSAVDLLRMWETGDGLTPPEQALIALGASLPDATRRELARISVGERAARLLALRQALSGPHMNCLVLCPECGQSLEFHESAHDLLDDYHQPDRREFEIEIDEVIVTFRLLTSDDLIAVSDHLDVEAARMALIGRCVLSATTVDGDPVDSLSAEAIADLGEALEARDPLSNIAIALRCDNCGHVWRAGFDIMVFLWAEIVRRAKATLQDVRVLAKRYGWSETDILTMSAARRAFYLEDGA